MRCLTKCTQSCDCAPMIWFWAPQRRGVVSRQSARSQLTRQPGNAGLRLEFAPPWHKLPHAALAQSCFVRSTTWSTAATSGLPRWTDILRIGGHVSKVPCMDGARGARGIWRFSEAFGCSHVSGLWMQPLWPLALMWSADRVPNKSTRSFLAWHLTGFPNRRSRPFRINVVFTPAVRERTDATSSSHCRAPC